MNIVSYGTGRRKTSTARVYLKSGNGKITINKKPVEEYFPREFHAEMLKAPLKTVDKLKDLDIAVFVKGGGNSGQAGAVKHGIARALLEMNQELRPSLKSEGHLTRDSRKVERKKYGKRGARASFQFSKR